MLFHSHIFLLLFLPVTVCAYFALGRSQSARIWCLIAASLVFYGYWDYRLLPLLAGSVCVNWLFARIWRGDRAWVIPAGILLNLLLLAIFKYADFFTGIAGGWNIILPLGISFFTFQQISYLVERGRGSAPLYSFRDYALFVTFFPQLIAGPIIRHNEIIAQFQQDPLRPGAAERASRGLLMLIIGLAKKVFIADRLARLADPIYAAAADGAAVSNWDGWVATLGFSLQIYFDFSAYSDMAIGLGLIFGFSFPINFNAPYRALSIQDFWRRWHMTLSRFLRDYLYIPLGGNRGGRARLFFALTATMLLGGLWHGAGWNFVLWGGAHGVGLIICHAWRRAGGRMPDWIAWGLTIGFVFASFVVFRADSLAAAGLVLAALAVPAAGNVAPVMGDLALIGAALLVAVMGPTSQKLALDLLTPRRLVAIVAAVIFVLALLQIGSGRNVEFIYFQF